MVKSIGGSWMILDGWTIPLLKIHHSDFWNYFKLL